jgi:hypothetical protein
MEDINVLKISEQLEKLSQQISGLVSSAPTMPNRSEDLKDLFGALAKAQAEMRIAGLTNENPYFKSRYADLAEMVRASRPALTKNGLSIIQQILPNSDGQNILNTILCHSSGQYIESRMRIIPAKNDIQSMGSYITYLKRYSYGSLVGIVTSSEDDDGEVAMIESRDIIARGPSLKYNPKESSFETISKDQIIELEYELSQYPDLAEEILTKMQIQSLADLPKSKFRVSIERIRKIKELRNNGIQK